jgi:predicted GNAT family acetyltransferase
MLRTPSVRLLEDRDVGDVMAILARDPVVNVFVTSRIEAAGLDPWRLGAEVWGYTDRGSGELTAICYSGANFVPVGDDPAAMRAFAERARRQGRRCSSIVGPEPAVAPLWRALLPHWGEARDVRPCQPLMATSRPSLIDSDPGVRRVALDDLDVLLPASVAMFTEEVGVSPDVGDGGALYRARVAEIVGSGRAFARIEDGRVIFKAEVGAATAAACQVQGVWVEPALRGTGLGAAGMASVVDEALRSIAPVVSLYVNDYNEPARRAYARVGFTDVGSFMSVLF